MLLRKGKHVHPNSDVPHIPWYKDEKFLKIFSAKWIIRVAAIGIIAFVALLTWGAIVLIDVVGELHQTQVTNHANNMLNQQQTDVKFRNLVCFAVEGNTQARASALRTQYHCPDANVPFSPQPLPTAASSLPAKPKPTATVTITAKPGAQATRTTTATATRTATATTTAEQTSTIHSIVTAIHTQVIRSTATRTIRSTATVTHTATPSGIIPCIKPLTC